MKHCVKCGAGNPDGAKFCTECGAAINTSETGTDTTYTYGENTSSSDAITSDDKYTYTYNADQSAHTSYSAVQPGIAPRNIVVAIILSLVTCGIYQLYWIFKINDEVNILASEPAATSGGLVLILDIVTCGIYGIYWSYKMGERCDRIKGATDGTSAILYLILTLLGFGIVTLCLIQDSINKAV